MERCRFRNNENRQNIQRQLKFYDDQTDNYLQTHYHLYWLQKWNNHLHSNVATHLTRGIGYYEEYKTDRNFLEYGLTPVVGLDTLETTDLVRQKWLDNYFYGITAALKLFRFYPHPAFLSNRVFAIFSSFV